MSTIQGLRALIRDEKPRDMLVGRVLAMFTDSARVLLSDGRVVPHIKSVSGVKVGDQVLVVRPEGTVDWRMISLTSEEAHVHEEAHNNNFCATPMNLTGYNLGSVLIWTWDMWPQFQGTFETQISEDVAHGDASSTAMPRGSVYIAPYNDVEAWCRVRSVNANQVYSNWTEWVTCGDPLLSTGPGGDGGYYEPLTNGDIDNPELIFARGDVIMVRRE